MASALVVGSDRTVAVWGPTGIPVQSPPLVADSSSGLLLFVPELAATSSSENATSNDLNATSSDFGALNETAGAARLLIDSNETSLSNSSTSGSGDASNETAIDYGVY